MVAIAFDTLLSSCRLPLHPSPPDDMKGWVFCWEWDCVGSLVSLGEKEEGEEKCLLLISSCSCNKDENEKRKERKRSEEE